jgi:hypothetical protein
LTATLLHAGVVLACLGASERDENRVETLTKMLGPAENPSALLGRNAGGAHLWAAHSEKIVPRLEFVDVRLAATRQPLEKRLDGPSVAHRRHNGQDGGARLVLGLCQIIHGGQVAIRFATNAIDELGDARQRREVSRVRLHRWRVWCLC